MIKRAWAGTDFAVWLAIVAGSLGIVFLILAAPALRPSRPGLSAVIYNVFAPLCHQIPGRCLDIRGFPMAVCARCAGIYSGFVAGAIFYPVLQGFGLKGGRRRGLPSLRVFAAFTAPIGVDVAGHLLRFWDSGNGLRLATGAVWGVILPFFVIPAIAEAVRTFRRRREESP